MPTVAVVRNPKLNLNYGHVFVIRSWTDLMSWWTDVRLPKSAVEFSDAARSRELTTRGDHAREGSYLVTLCHAGADSLVNTLVKLNERVLQGMLQCLQKDGGICINRSGGYFPLSRELDITYEHEVDKFVLPDDKVRVLQWANGKHWYAKLGDIDVVWEDKQKWDTKEEAERAAECFLKQIAVTG